MKISKELLKGSTAIMILKIISEGDTYGYRIAQSLTLRSDNVFQLKEGTLYPILHALETEKLVESYKKTENGRERKYYCITQLGKIQLALQLDEWKLFANSVNSVLEGGN